MKTEHILLCEDHEATWLTRNAQENAPDLRQQGTHGLSAETRKGKLQEIAPITIEVQEFSAETQAYMKRWSS